MNNKEYLLFQENDRRRIAEELHDKTVQDMVCVSQKLELAMLYMDKDITVSGNKTVAGFNDYNQIESWAVGAANWAYSNGIVSGRDGNLLAPKATATRAEVSQIFMKYLQNVK